MPLVALLPVADGASSTWTAAPGGTQRFEAVMDPYGPDDNATICQGTGTGQDLMVKTQGAPSLPPIARVGWVGVWARVGRNLVASVTPLRFTPRIRLGALDYVGPTPVGLTASQLAYVDYSGYDRADWRLETNPATGKEWTVAEALAAEVGIRDVTAAGTHVLKCTALRKLLQVAYFSASPVGRPA